MSETGIRAKRCKHYAICKNFKKDRPTHKEFGKRLAELADAAHIIKKRYDKRMDDLYEEVMGHYWPTETER